MRLITEWRQAWRMLSMQAMGLAAAVQGAWLGLPGDLRAMVPPHLVYYLTLALMVLGIVGRLVHQPAVSGLQDPAQPPDRGVRP
jgi:hypothetical protein